VQGYNIDEIYDDMYIEEMIDGKIYLMARPNNKHMLIQKNLNSIFENYFKGKKKKCTVFSEMELDIDNRNHMEPDLAIYCKDNNDKKNKKIPLIIVEILSDSTWKKDMTAKMKKYAELGIEEYWIIDPRIQRLTIYKLEEHKYELFETYFHPLEDSFSIYSKVREQQEREIVKSFSPAFFSDLTILLEDVFNFEDLELIE